MCITIRPKVQVGHTQGISKHYMYIIIQQIYIMYTYIAICVASTNMHLDKQPYKHQNMKNLLEYCKYISSNAISSLKQAKWCLVFPLQNFSTIKVFLPALLTGINLQNFIEIKVISVGKKICYSDCNTRSVPLSVLCLFILNN